jgi:hypothetical protein
VITTTYGESYISSLTSYTTTRTTVFPTVITKIVSAVQVRWAATDLPSLETHPLSPGVKPTSAIPATAGGPTGSTFEPSQPQLTPAAKAAIGLGTVLGVALLAGLVLLGVVLFRRRERGRGEGISTNGKLRITAATASVGHGEYDDEDDRYELRSRTGPQSPHSSAGREGGDPHCVQHHRQHDSYVARGQPTMLSSPPPTYGLHDLDTSTILQGGKG